MKKIITILSLLVLAANVSFAQVTVKGTIKDAKGEPVPGAVVMLENDSRTGAVTDVDGKYTLTLPKGSTPSVTISCIGYKTTTYSVKGKAILDAVLEDDAELLDEVVVVGYGAMRRSDLTGSVTSVKIDEENAMKSTTFDQILEGRAAGVQVLSDSGDPDAGISIRIRGNSTFSGDSEPLYVVDGVIINGTSGTVASVSSSVSLDESRSLTTVNPLSGINPNDIASMEILKDASATAIYGSQGANGVVLITTKQANREKPVVNFNAGVSVSEASRRLRVMTFDEYCDYVELYSPSTLDNLFENPSTREGLKVTPMDWQDYIFRTAVSQRYYLSISGKPSGYNYFVSLGYNSTQGILKNTDSDAVTARINLSKDIAKNVKLSFKSTFGYTFSNIQNGGGAGAAMLGYSSIMQSIMQSRPYIYLDPNKVGEEEIDEDLEESTDYTRFNPKRMQEGTRKTVKRFRITPSLSLDWNILKWLSFRTTFGADFTTNNNRNSKTEVISNGVGNIAGYGDSKSVRWNWDNLLMFNKKWGKHSINGTLGHSMSRVAGNSQSISARNLPQRYAFGDNINYAETTYSYLDGYSESVSSLMSYFGRAIYNFDDRYVLTATLRFDGSSRFKGANKWGIFPSAAFAWRIAKEPWFDVPVISNAKLRLGWGQVGNQNIGNYLTAPVISTTYYANHAAESLKETAVYQSNIINEGLKWETTEQVNVGIDLSFFKGRLALTADWYTKDTKDLLQSKNVATSTGFSSMSVNDGVIRNRGLEFSIDAVPVKSKDFEWTLGGNISFNRNTLIDVGAMGSSATLYLSPDSEAVECNYFFGSAIQSTGAFANYANIFIEGQPMGLFYGYEFLGIVQEGETRYISAGTPIATGMPYYKDLDGDGVITTADRCVIGDPNPDFTYGFNTSLSYKRFTLTMNFIGSYGNDRINANRTLGATSLGYSKNSLYEAVSNAWTPYNKTQTYMKGNVQDYNYASRRYVEDGSYLRVNNISLSYQFPISKSARVLRGLGLSLSVSNPFIFTNYTGYSPVTNSYGSNVKRMGVDLNTTPYPRSYNFDLKFTF